MAGSTLTTSAPVQDLVPVAHATPLQHPTHGSDVQNGTNSIPAHNSQDLDSYSRSTEDIMYDYIEVDRVVQGGMGSSLSQSIGWPALSEATTQMEDTSLPQQDPLPFSSTDIPSSFLVPAKPVARTNNLKEVKIR